MSHSGAAVKFPFYHTIESRYGEQLHANPHVRSDRLGFCPDIRHVTHAIRISRNGVDTQAPTLPVRATSQQSSDFIMVAQERNEQLIASVLENESEIAVAATLKKFVRQLANTEAAMDMGLAKTPNEITKRQ